MEMHAPGHKTSLISRLRLMRDDDGVREAQRLLDSEADAKMDAAILATQNKQLRAALAGVLRALEAGDAEAAKAAATQGLQQPAPHVKG